MGYLDENGLKRIWDKTKAYVDSSAASNVNGWAYCGTGSTTAAKTVSIPSIKTLVTGTVITIRFGYTINTANSTLNVSSTGAKPIYYNNKPLSIGAIQADDIVSFVYYSSRWQVIGSLNQAGIATDYFGSLDFNRYIVPGRYIIHRNGETFLNGPGSQMTGWLDVMENQGLITQTMTDYTGRLVNIRGCYNNSWSQWATYSGAYQPLVGGTLNFRSGTSQVTRNLSYFSVIGDRVFVDFSFQCSATNNTTLYFTNYPTPVSDYDGRFYDFNIGAAIKYSCSTYTNNFYVMFTSTFNNGWIRGQFSYRTNGVNHT
ncbi:pyocin knob domain-containing protein [Robinsoniella peoriensis]